MTIEQMTSTIDRALNIYAFYPPHEKYVHRVREPDGYKLSSSNISLIKDIARIASLEVEEQEKHASVFIKIT